MFCSEFDSCVTLSRNSALPLSSVTSFRGERANPGEVGRVLDVKAVLMGRVVQRGNSLFISAELVDARDNSQI